MPHICLVEDEEKVAAFIIKGLQERGFEITHAKDGDSAKRLFLADNNFDLVILDIMLPDTSGVDICRLIRERNSLIPILMLTALNRVDDKVSGLEAGADDYLVKPFHFKELVARLNALLRRTQPEGAVLQPASMLTFEDLKLNTLSKTAERAGTEIILTSKEYQLLEMFMRNPNRTLSRDDIADKVWGIQFRTGTNFIDVYINYLRNKIEKGLGSKLIHTVIGMGYILKKEKQA
ncbi:MAG: response regulator transcription factor [Bacteroidota bacterium]